MQPNQTPQGKPRAGVTLLAVACLLVGGCTMHVHVWGKYYAEQAEPTTTAGTLTNEADGLAPAWLAAQAAKLAGESEANDDGSE